jgi:type II secretion system protein C
VYSRLKTYLGQTTRYLLSTRGVVTLLGKLALIAAIGLGYKIGDSFRLAERNRAVPPEIENQSTPLPEDTHTSLDGYSIISTRNLFGRKSGPSQEQKPQAAKAPLKLRLVGTNVGPGVPFAIIEETGKGDQDIFDINQMIFEQARLVEVAKDQVKVEQNGKVEILRLEEGAERGGPESLSSGGEGTDFTVQEDELSKELANLPRLLSQARAVPYFRNGQSIGMRLFAIRKDSMYEKLGLQNGDILKSVNETSLSDPSQALKIFEQLKSERSINLTLERGGADKTLHYAIR